MLQKLPSHNKMIYKPQNIAVGGRYTKNDALVVLTKLEPSAGQLMLANRIKVTPYITVFHCTLAVTLTTQISLGICVCTVYSKAQGNLCQAIMSNAAERGKRLCLYKSL